MNSPYRAGHKKPHATVYRHTEHDPPEGTLVAVASGCQQCGHGATGQQLADALNAQLATDETNMILTNMISQVAALLIHLPQEERRQRLRDAYDSFERRSSGGVPLTAEVLDRCVAEAENGYDPDQITPRTADGGKT